MVTLVTKGGRQTRTKHLQARMNLGKEMVDEVRAKMLYTKGKDMQADGFSKPYNPVKHKPFAKLILGEDKNSVNRWALDIGEIDWKSENGFDRFNFWAKYLWKKM